MFELRPGFNPWWSWKSPVGLDILSIHHDPKQDQFACLDDHCITFIGRKCDPLHPYSAVTVQSHQVHFDSKRNGFITALLFVEQHGLFFAACLDQTLRLYDSSFKLQSTMRWHAGVVTQLLYSKALDEVITAGAEGLKTWFCQSGMRLVHNLLMPHLTYAFASAPYCL